MDALTLKTAAMCWLRFGRQLTYVGTEIGDFSSDVLGASDEKMYEIETKVSRTDLKKDFTKPKHSIYKQDNPRTWGVPNYFYFLVPEFLKDFAIELCNSKNPKLGVLVYKDGDGPMFRLADRLYVAKKATKLHDHAPKPQILEKMAKRLSSDLCNTYLRRVAEDSTWKELIASSKALCDTKDLDAATDELPRGAIVMDDSPPPLPQVDTPAPLTSEQLVDTLEPDWMGYAPGSMYEAVRDGIRVGLEYRLEEIERLKAEIETLKKSSGSQPSS